MGAIFQPKIVHSSDLDNIPIMDGRVLHTYDRNEEYFDYNNERIRITDIIQLDTYNDLRKLENPINGKFYYIKEKDFAQMYYFNGEEFIKTSGYTHPVYPITSGSYRCVTINKMGHVIEASNEILPVDFGGTGVNNLESLREKMNIPTNEEYSDLNNSVQTHEESIENINKSIENINISISQILSQINNIYLTYENGSYYIENVKTDRSIDTSTGINTTTNSYYMRDVESDEWILDDTDNSYYITIFKDTYGLGDSFPITSIYRKTDDGYNMSHGAFDTNDYSITVNDNLDITIKTTTPFACKIIINTV